MKKGSKRDSIIPVLIPCTNTSMSGYQTFVL